MQSRNRHGPAFRRGAGLIALTLALVCAAIPTAATGAPHQREGFHFGAEVGFSQGRATLFPGAGDDKVESDWKMGVTPQFRVGYAVVKNRLMVSIANQQWLYEQGVLAEDKLRVNSQNWALNLTFYPGKPASGWGGLYVLGGIGLANARLTILEPIEEDAYGNKFEEVVKEDERGTAYQIAVGYEFRITRLFAAGLSVGYIYQTYDGEIFEKTEVMPTNLTLNWYW